MAAIDLSREKPIPFNEAAAEYLPDGMRPSLSTWWRWRSRGLNGVKLATICIGGRRFTTAEALHAFFAAVTEAANGSSAPATRTPTQRDREIERADRELHETGF